MRLRDLVELRRRQHVAPAPEEAGLARVVAPGRIEPHDAADLVHHLQPAADMQRRGRHHVAVLDDAELGGAAADVDVEDALVLVMRHLRGARAIGRQHRLHVVPGGGGDEIAALLRQQAGDGLGILAPQRLAGEDHHAGVDVVGLHAGGGVGGIDDGAERGVVDALVAGIGRQRHRRLEQGLARDDVVAAGEVLAVAAQVDAREDDLGAGRADVDADGHQRDVVLDPDRVVFQPLLDVEVEVIVVVIGIAVVGVDEVLAEEMVGERVARFLVVGIGHSSLLLAGSRAAVLSHGARAVIGTADMPGESSERWQEIGPRKRACPAPGRRAGSALRSASLTAPGRAVTLRRPPTSSEWMRP